MSIISFSSILYYKIGDTMTEPLKIPQFTSGRGRLAELREQGNLKETTESIGSSRSTLIINLAIDIFSGIIFIVGFWYLIKFFLLRREHLDPAFFHTWLGIIFLIALFWLAFFVVRIRHRYMLLKKHSSEN